MADLHELLATAVQDGAVPGAVGLVSSNGRPEVEAVGDAERDSIFRVASLTKPITAAAALQPRSP